jgi:hypothetical protein
MKCCRARLSRLAEASKEVSVRTHSGSSVDQKEQERRFLRLGHRIAAHAVRLPPADRLAYIRAEIADLRQIYAPIHNAKPGCTGQRLLDSLEKWVMRIVRILERDQRPSDNSPI